MTYEQKSEEYRRAAERALEEYLPAAKADERVAEAMRYSLLGGGKRVRATLVLAVADMLTGDCTEALPAAAAAEMVHAYSLIHDDLPCMDDSGLRRGKPACHIAYGEETALLAGDGLLTLAFRTLCHLSDAVSVSECIFQLSDAAGYKGMIRGQELDLAAEGENPDVFSADDLCRIHRHKTGALISASAAMGAVIGKGDQADCDAILGYAADIGMVFQIVDDLLDALSDTGTLGKPAGSDRGRQKKTYATVYGVDRSRESAKELTRRANRLIEKQFGERARYLAEFAERLMNRLR